MKTEDLFIKLAKRILPVLVLAVGLSLSLPLELQAQQAVVEVGLATIPTGSTGPVKVSLRGAASGLSDFQGRLTYDPTVLNVREIAGLNGYTIAAFQIDNFEGEVRFIGFKSSGTLITEGDFVQFTIAPVGDSGDSSPLEMEFISLNSASGPIEHTIRPGRLTIGARREIEVDFSWSPPNPEAGQALQFTDTTSGGSGTFTRWSWDFGDGGNSTSQNPTHTYNERGTFTVSLVVEDDQGNSNSGTQQLTVRGAGEPITIPAHNYPNPASSETTFSYQLPQGASQAILTIYAFTGPLVLSHTLNASSNEFRWNLKDLHDQDLPNGAYYYRIWASTPDGALLSKIGKLVIIR